jgi:hypothetical protein
LGVSRLHGVLDILLALKDEDSYCVRHPVVLIASASFFCEFFNPMIGFTGGLIVWTSISGKP